MAQHRDHTEPVLHLVNLQIGGLAKTLERKGTTCLQSALDCDLTLGMRMGRGWGSDGSIRGTHEGKGGAELPGLWWYKLPAHSLHWHLHLWYIPIVPTYGTSCLRIHNIDTFICGTTNCTNLTYLPMAWYLSMVQAACPFITLTPSRGKKYAQLRIHYSVILLAIYSIHPFS